MRIVRKINNSAAVAQDSRGKELIVIGKGIGFPAVPYELTDMSRIDRTFYDIDPRYHRGYGYCNHRDDRSILCTYDSLWL